MSGEDCVCAQCPPSQNWYNGLCKDADGKQLSLSGCSNELTLAALPPTLLAGALAVGAYFLLQAGLSKSQQRAWASDVREQQQAASNRFQQFSAVILTGGIIGTALAVFKLAALAAAGISAMTVFGGIWVGVGSAVALNYLVHNRAYADDGHKAIK